MSAGDAALYEEPFRWVKERVYPMRQQNRREAYREYWWRHVEPRPGMWGALGGLSRYIATARLAKHRLFGWYDVRICPDSQLIVIARDDDTTFGILHSRFHELWSLRLGTSLEDRPRYTPSTTFETFPVPAGLTPNVPAVDYEEEPRATAIAVASRRLVELRDRWLNPPEWVDWMDQPAPGYPRRPVPRDEEAAQALRKRTLTNLYNARPQWLVDAHAALDTAVAATYGWPADITDDDALLTSFCPSQVTRPHPGLRPARCRVCRGGVREPISVPASARRPGRSDVVGSWLSGLRADFAGKTKGSEPCGCRAPEFSAPSQLVITDWDCCPHGWDSLASPSSDCSGEHKHH